MLFGADRGSGYVVFQDLNAGLRVVHLQNQLWRPGAQQDLSGANGLPGMHGEFFDVHRAGETQSQVLLWLDQRRAHIVTSHSP